MHLPVSMMVVALATILGPSRRQSANTLGRQPLLHAGILRRLIHPGSMQPSMSARRSRWMVRCCFKCAESQRTQPKNAQRP